MVLEAAWSPEEAEAVVEFVVSQLPEDDKRSATYQMGKLDWSDFSLPERTTQECSELFGRLITKTRHFRLLSELCRDVKAGLADNLKHYMPILDYSANHSKPFDFYAKSKLEKFMEKHPGKSKTEAHTKLKKRFEKLDDETKSAYVEQAKENRAKQKAALLLLNEERARDRRLAEGKEFYASRRAEKKMRKDPARDRTALLLKYQNEFDDFDGELKERWAAKAETARGEVSVLQDSHISASVSSTPNEAKVKATPSSVKKPRQRRTGPTRVSAWNQFMAEKRREGHQMVEFRLGEPLRKLFDDNKAKYQEMADKVNLERGLQPASVKKLTPANLKEMETTVDELLTNSHDELDNKLLSPVVEVKKSKKRKHNDTALDLDEVVKESGSPKTEKYSQDEVSRKKEKKAKKRKHKHSKADITDSD